MSNHMMRGIVFLGDRRAEVRDFPVPEPGAGQVLVQLKVAAICGSDLHVYRMPESHFEGRAPWIPGHEPAGVVVALGEGCERVQVGDRVSIYHYLACGHCRYCLTGYYQWCERARGLGQPNAVGPDADYLVVDERNCLPLPDELSFEDGALIACIAATGYSAMRKLQPNGEKTLIVFGQGPVGLTGAIMGRALGAYVIGVDVMEERLALSSRLGTDAVINPSTTDPGAAVAELTGGLGADLAFETSGSPAGQQAMIQVLRRQGKAVIVGAGSSEPSINLSALIGKELVLMGSFVMPISYYWDLTRFMIRHKLSAKFREMITHRFPLGEAEEAFRIADSRTAGKVVFVWE